MPNLIQAARRSIGRGTSTRQRRGMTASSVCVSAPYAQTRPQYSRPHRIVYTTVKPKNRYHARLYFTTGQFQSTMLKMLVIEIR